jgi:hypothetical protein
VSLFGEKNLIFHSCLKKNPRQILNKHVWETGDVHTGFWCGDLGVKDHLEDPGVDGRIILTWTFKQCIGIA